jgi:hypothetical protein
MDWHYTGELGVPADGLCKLRTRRLECVTVGLGLTRAFPIRQEQTMQTHSVVYGDFSIVVRPLQNALGAWIADVSVTRGDQTVVDTRPLTVQPEWLTEEEAVRDGEEWGRRFIDREFNTHPSDSWVADRARAEVWFRDTGKS